MASRSSLAGARASPDPGVKSRSPSQMSPTNISRTQEAKTLGHLNDRLAQYIHRGKELEMMNNSILQQVTTMEETNKKEIITIRERYEQELSQVWTIDQLMIMIQLFISNNFRRGRLSMRPAGTEPSLRSRPSD